MMIEIFILCLVWLGVDGCREPIDLLFLVDGSSEVSSSDFIQQKAFISSQPMEYFISPNGVRIGAIIYSDIGWEKVDFKISENDIEFVNRISRITQPGGERVINNALKAAHELFISEARPGSKRMVILLTTGRSRTLWESFRQAREMRKDHISLFAIGVGNKISHSELMGITSDRNSVLVVDTFQDLFSLSARLHELICPAYNSHHQILSQDPSLFKAEVEMSIITNSDNKGESPLLPQRVHLIDNYSVDTYLTTTPTTTTTSSTVKPNLASRRDYRYNQNKSRYQNVRDNNKPNFNTMTHQSAPSGVHHTVNSEKVTVQKSEPSSKVKLRNIPFGFVDESITDLKQISLFKKKEISKSKRSQSLSKNSSMSLINDMTPKKDHKEKQKAEDKTISSSGNAKSVKSLYDRSAKNHIAMFDSAHNAFLPKPVPFQYIDESVIDKIPTVKPSPISIPAFEQPLILINERSIWDTLIGDIQPIIKYKYRKPKVTTKIENKVDAFSAMTKNRKTLEEITPSNQQIPTHVKPFDPVRSEPRQTQKFEDKSKGILFKAHQVNSKIDLNEKTSKTKVTVAKSSNKNAGILFKASTIRGMALPDNKNTLKSGNMLPKSEVKVPKERKQTVNRIPFSSIMELPSIKALSFNNFDKQTKRQKSPISPASSISVISQKQKPTTLVPAMSRNMMKKSQPLKHIGRNVLNMATRSLQKPTMATPTTTKSTVINVRPRQKQDKRKNIRNGKLKPTQKTPRKTGKKVLKKDIPANTGPIAFTKDLKKEVTMLLEILMLEHDRMMKGKKKKKPKKGKKKSKKEDKITKTTPAALLKNVKSEKKIKLPSKISSLLPQKIRNRLKPRNREKQNGWNFRRPASFRPGSEIKQQYLAQQTQKQDDDKVSENENCHLKPYDKDASFYIERTENRTVKRPCPDGTAFDVQSCACTIMTITRSMSDCQPEILLDFNNNLKDTSGKNIHVGSDHIEIHNGSALFLENGDITIWRFTGSHIGRQLMIQARFKATKDPETRQYIISNCNYGTDISYGIEIDRVEEVVIFSLDTEPRDRKEIRIPFELDKWTSVALIYDGLRFTAEVNGMRKSMPLAGDVETRSSPLRIGGCGIQQNRFSGYIDEVSMSFCIPKKRRSHMSG